MFHVGQKVTAVLPPNLSLQEEGEVPYEMGMVYTIRSIEEFAPFGIGLRFVEIKNPPVATVLGVMERGWHQEYFRPIVEQKTDISVFEKMLNPKEVEKV